MRGGRVVCDVAGNCATAGPVGGLTVDKRSPAISIAAPVGGYLLQQTVTAGYECVDGGSGVAGCTGPIANGAPVDTTHVGSFGFTVDATDAVGNQATATASHTVSYAVELDDGVARPRRPGDDLRIRLELRDANGANVSSATIPVIALGVDADRSLGEAFEFRRGANRYAYTLDTTGLTPGIHVLNIQAGDDPTIHQAEFTIRAPRDPRPRSSSASVRPT